MTVKHNRFIIIYYFRAEVVDYYKTVVFDCHLYVCIVISNTSGCLALIS